METLHKRVRRVALIGGVGAVVALGALGIGHDAGVPATAVAGSGDAPTGTQYVQPTVKAMVLGATTTTAVPAPAVSAKSG
jgi:hypothetical protein